MKKGWMALILAGAMALSLLGTFALAVEEEGEPGEEIVYPEEEIVYPEEEEIIYPEEPAQEEVIYPAETPEEEPKAPPEIPATPGVHEVEGNLYLADRQGKLVKGKQAGAYAADEAGVLTQKEKGYQMQNVPYLSQIDNIYAWVGCEGVAALMGLQAKGFAKDVTLKDYLDGLPRSASGEPEKGFVGSPYVPDTSKRTRTTIYPAKLAEYSNTYCGGAAVCADFRGASVEELQRELLAGNCVVGYLTLWWEAPFYRSYEIEGKTQKLVSNNHAVLVCGYDPDKGYYISDPYNYYHRGQTYQYWQPAASFEKIWNARQVGMVIR